MSMLKNELVAIKANLLFPDVIMDMILQYAATDYKSIFSLRVLPAFFEEFCVYYNKFYAPPHPRDIMPPPRFVMMCMSYHRTYQKNPNWRNYKGLYLIPRPDGSPHALTLSFKEQRILRMRHEGLNDKCIHDLEDLYDENAIIEYEEEFHDNDNCVDFSVA